VDYSGLLWTTVDPAAVDYSESNYSELQWTAVDCSGLQWTTVDYNEPTTWTQLQWTTMDYQTQLQ
jgi:hypothetical protein